MITRPSRQLSKYLGVLSTKKPPKLHSVQSAHSRGVERSGATVGGQVARRESEPERIAPTTSSIVQLADSSGSGAARESSYPPPIKPLSGTYLGEDGNLYSDLRIGMPLMGRCNLAESPLLKEMGHLRWQHIEALTGIPSIELADEEGDRLYATFFYVEIVFPPERPMAAFVENDEVTIVSQLRRFGRLMLDGESYLCPSETQPSLTDLESLSTEVASSRGIPYVRLSNMFVKQWGGADWLKKGYPANSGLTNIPGTKSAPVGAVVGPEVRIAQSFPAPDETFTLLTEHETKTLYQIVPDRDINGVGLLYFANYPRYLDICERDTLSGLPIALFDDELLDLRTLVLRRSAYFSNARADDVLEVYVRCWIENPFLNGCPEPARSPVNLHLNYRMKRQSDQRLMLVATAKKTIYGKTLGETPLLDYLRDK